MASPTLGAPLASRLRARRRDRSDGRIARHLFEPGISELNANLIEVGLLHGADDELHLFACGYDIDMRHQLPLELVVLTWLTVNGANAHSIWFLRLSGHQGCSLDRVKPRISSPTCHSRRSTLPWPVLAEENRLKPCSLAGVWTTRALVAPASFGATSSI